MPRIAEIASFIDAFAPFSTAQSWDNSGVLVDCGNDITAVLVTLDITDEVVAEAEMQGCQLILAHHPVIFAPLRAVVRGTPAYRLVKKNISAICAHTNLDAATGGVSDMLARVMGVEQPLPFADGLGRVGGVDSTTAQEVAAACKVTLRAAGTRYCDAGRPVDRLAVVGGAGGSLWKEALAAGANCLLTGEVSHHEALDARAAGLSTVAAGHFATEYPILPVLREMLTRRFPGLRVIVSRRGRDPFALA